MKNRTFIFGLILMYTCPMTAHKALNEPEQWVQWTGVIIGLIGFVIGFQKVSKTIL